MPIFHYQVIDNTGKRIDGTMEAKDRFALYHLIKKDGNTVVFTEEARRQKLFSISSIFPFLAGVSQHDKIIFARNLAKMIEAGLPISRGLSIMEREAIGQLKKVLIGLNESLGKGSSLSDAMKNYPNVFSTLFISMTKAGEESGNLSMALQNVALQMEKSYQLNKKIRGALMYPGVILSLMVVIGVLMMVYMVPTLTATFKSLNISLPLSTRIIIGISDFLKTYFIFVIFAAIAFGFAFSVSIRTSLGHRIIDIVILRIPIIKEMVKQINSARTARTLSSLLTSGVDIIVAIGVTKDILQNSYYKKVLEETQTAIQKGESISKVFLLHENLYPMFVSEMVSVGEETGKIGEMLMSVATFYEEEIDQKTKDMSSVIEPFLMIFIGVAVGFFAISMISPIYSIGDGIK